MIDQVQEIFNQRPINQTRYPLPKEFNRYAHYLTQREALIVSKLVKGKRPKEIAWELDSSLHTINTHLANIKQKLGCKSIFELGMTLGEIKIIVRETSKG